MAWKSRRNAAERLVSVCLASPVLPLREVIVVRFRRRREALGHQTRRRLRDLRGTELGGQGGPGDAIRHARVGHRVGVGRIPVPKTALSVRNCHTGMMTAGS